MAEYLEGSLLLSGLLKYKKLLRPRACSRRSLLNLCGLRPLTEQLFGAECAAAG